MNDYERIELAARRTATRFANTELGAAFTYFADNLVKLKREEIQPHREDEIPF